MKNTCIVWGKQHGSDTLIKLHREGNLKAAHEWMERNRKYYDDMRVYYFHEPNT